MFGMRREESNGLSWKSLAIGFAAGLGTWYLLEPRRGAARRSMLRDRAASELRDAARTARRKAHRAADRARGAIHEAQARVTEEHVPDDILIERVRAQIGRPVSHPRAIEIHANDGTVVLSGNVLRREVDDLVARVEKIRGVRHVENRLSVHAEPGSTRDLQ